MENFNTKLMTALAKGESIHEIFRQALEDAVNLLLESERTVFLDYEKWDIKGYYSGNSRNGYYSRRLKTEYGTLELKIPRDRLGQLEIQTVKALKESHSHLEQMIILMYQKRITTREISDLIEKLYGHYYSAATIRIYLKILKMNCMLIIRKCFRLIMCVFIAMQPLSQ